VCRAELGGGDSKCLTYRKLASESDPEDWLITALLAANGGEQPNTKGWRTARDGTHTWWSWISSGRVGSSSRAAWGEQGGCRGEEVGVGEGVVFST
jgi:hypothetical protein